MTFMIKSLLLIPFMFMTWHLLEPACQASGRVPEILVHATVDTVKSKVKGEVQAPFSVLRSGKLKTGSARIIKIETQNGADIPFAKTGDTLTVKGSITPATRVRIFFETRVSGKSPVRGGRNLISKDYVLLMDSWCPILDRPATYRLTLTINSELTPVSESDEVVERHQGKTKEVTFIFDHVRESITVAAGRFSVTEARKNGVRLFVYTLKKRPKLSKKILDALKEGLVTYERLLSPYPFKRFQVVENPAPTGVTVPTITLIGSQIIDKPFVLNTSLIHEFVHSWFGNSVLVAEKGGNWCEGLTTYMADYLMEEKQGKGALYRHDILSDYKSYVHDSTNSLALSRFRSRYDRISKAVGYGKGAMVFHMLRRMVGDEAFFSEISRFSKDFRFKTASWKDIEQLFSSRYSAHRLHAFFDQWLNRTDVPVISIKGCWEEKNEDGTFNLILDISQENEKPYELDIPVRILTEKGTENFVIRMCTAQIEVRLETKHQPRLVILDHAFDLMRDLSQDEFPPSLSRLLGAEKRLMVLPEKKELLIYKPAISFFRARGFRPIERKTLKHGMLKEGAFLVLGSVTGRLESFCPEIEERVEGVTIRVGLNPLNKNHVVALLKASSAKELQQAIHKIPHYGRFSLLRFKSGVLKAKKAADFERGIDQRVTLGLSGIFSQNIKSIHGITKGLEGHRVVYLGEKHDQEGIHQAQLRIIKELSSKERLAVGMEMFQRPFQGVIDSYLKGKISEKEFLRKSEYFKRWAFNYHFYRPIVEYCKENAIPIVALNLPTEISKKIARKGISSLNQEERKALPVELDFTNDLYKRYLKKVYANHNSGELDDFENFFQAQIAWDETMAQTITNYLKRHPEHNMVVLVGGGHVEYGYGIPSRVKKKLPEITQVKALFNNDPDDPAKADLFLHAPQVEAPFTPKLGVLLSGENRLTVEAVVPGSPASRAGIKKGDIITQVGGKAVKDIYDLKLELFFMKKGERVTLGIKRRNKKGGFKNLELVTGELVPFSWRRAGMGFHSSK